jgi:hypothetical protein
VEAVPAKVGGLPACVWRGVLRWWEVLPFGVWCCQDSRPCCTMMFVPALHPGSRQRGGLRHAP